MDTITQVRGERWQFGCDESGGWSWRRRTADGSVAASSTRAFATLDRALEDAVRNGFTYRRAARQPSG